MAASPISVLFLSQWSQILIYGFNTILFSIGMYLLSKRKTRDGTIFQAASSAVVFALATTSVLLGTSVTIAGLGTPTAPSKINVRAASITIFIVLHLIDLAAFITLVYRCFNIWSRSWKIIAAPLVAMTAVTGVYFAGLPQYIKTDYGAGLQSADVLKESRVSTIVAVAFSAFTHTLLTTLIASRIWWVKRQLRQIVLPENRARHSSLRIYDSVIALTVESGMIIPIFEIIYIVFFNELKASSADDNALTAMATSIFPSILPQVLAFTPLLIMVRVGLGLTVEREHVSELSTMHASSTIPRFLDSTSREVRTSAVADPADEIELDFRGRESQSTNRQPTEKNETSDTGSQYINSSL
ncbi:hypothetical protein PQX77_016841 [Marasmius sp. AFHP31]|nr:hypothetical protein PQX77_016841 [Marasmius sp. AFHP31]